MNRITRHPTFWAFSAFGARSASYAWNAICLDNPSVVLSTAVIPYHGVHLVVNLFWLTLIHRVAIARALSAVALVDLIYWTGYPLLTIVGGAHQDARKRATMPKEFFEKVCGRIARFLRQYWHSAPFISSSSALNRVSI